MKKNRLYRELAYLYPLIDIREHHAPGASLWRIAPIKQGPGQDQNHELGAGRGDLAPLNRSRFSVEGLGHTNL